MPKQGARTENDQKSGGSSSGSRPRFPVAAAAPSPAEPAPERRLSTEEARQYWAAYASVPEDVCLPDGWEFNRNRVPVPPPPRGHARLQEIHRQRAGLTPELRADPLYAVNSPEWDRVFEVERQMRLNSFFATSPPSSWFDSDEDGMLSDDPDEEGVCSGDTDYEGVCSDYTDDEGVCSDDPDAAQTDADLYVRQPGEVGWVEPPGVTDGGSAGAGK